MRGRRGNVDAERQARAIRLRAERRCGEMLVEMQKAKGGAQPGVGRRGNAGMRSDDPTALPKPLRDLGISKTQSAAW